MLGGIRSFVCSLSHKARCQTRRLIRGACCPRDETYKKDPLLEGITAYDKELMAYWQAIGRTYGLPWSANTANTYERAYFRKTAEVARSQGFAFNQ